jgi:hypothetical protein
MNLRECRGKTYTNITLYIVKIAAFPITQRSSSLLCYHLGRTIHHVTLGSRRVLQVFAEDITGSFIEFEE